MYWPLQVPRNGKAFKINRNKIVNKSSKIVIITLAPSSWLPGQRETKDWKKRKKAEEMRWGVQKWFLKWRKSCYSNFPNCRAERFSMAGGLIIHGRLLFTAIPFQDARKIGPHSNMQILKAGAHLAKLFYKQYVCKTFYVRLKLGTLHFLNSYFV
jgi:hypothetical protein